MAKDTPPICLNECIKNCLVDRKLVSSILLFDELVEPALTAAFEMRRARCDVLHIPCGDGLFSARMVELGWNLTCADSIEMNLIRTSQALAEADAHAVLLKASLPSLPVADRTFDICIALTALLSPASLDANIKELNRIMRSDGLIVLGVEGIAGDFVHPLINPISVINGNGSASPSILLARPLHVNDGITKII